MIDSQCIIIVCTHVLSISFSKINEDFSIGEDGFLRETPLNRRSLLLRVHCIY